MRTAVFCMLAAAVCVHGETSEERGKRVIDDAIKALGGQNFLSVRDRTEICRAYSFYHEKMTGLTQAVFKYKYAENAAPGKVGVRERESFGKDEKFGAVLFNEEGGFQLSYKGARPMPDETLQRYRETTIQNVFYILRMRLKEPGLTIQSKGADVVDNAPVELVEIADSENRQVIVAFHRSTKLPVQQTFYRRDPKTNLRIEEKTYFAKYRDIGGGVMWPYSVARERDGEKIFEQYSEQVKINQGLSDQLFSLPAGTTVLKPIN